MPEPKKILATRRRSEFLVFRRRFNFDAFCAECGAETSFLSLDDAIRLVPFSMREIVQAADAGEIHFLESRQGLLVVCLTSLTARAQTIRAFINQREGKINL